MRFGIESPRLYNEMKKEFDVALQKAGGNYVPRPRSLNRLARLKRKFVSDSRARGEDAITHLRTRASETSEQYGIPKLEAADLYIRAWDIENRLMQEGAIFGERAFNFSISRLELSTKEEAQISNSCLDTMKALTILSLPRFKSLFPELPMNNAEMMFDQLGSSPEAARIDICLTEDGPKIIEVNTQWVDAIAALSGFLKVFGEASRARKVIRCMSDAFPVETDLAIIDIQQTKGSRALGARYELGMLAQLLEQEGRIRTCEVLDPYKIRPCYLEKFKRFYINCDPKYFSSDMPDWLQTIYRKTQSDKGSLFPAWAPLVDKKYSLALLTNPPEALEEELEESGISVKNLRNSVAVTYPLSQAQKTNEVIKGDGYSLNAVAIPGTAGYEQFRDYALQEPSSYVVQPFLESKRTNAWVYDTGSQRLRYLNEAYTKLNVWYINGEVVGMLATVDESPLISDRGFNTVPLVRD